MKKLALTLAIVAGTGLAACQSGGGNNSAERNDASSSGEAVSTTDNSLTVNTSALGERLENAAEDAGNFATNAGQALENGAESVVNEVRENTRSDGREGETNRNER